MLYHLLVGAVGTAALLGAWAAVQSLKRRSDPSIPEGGDVLACGRSCGEFACGCAAMTAVGESAKGACPANRGE
jgi:hypothetical protein